MNPIGEQCYEVQLSDGTRQVFHKDHIKPFYISEEEDRVPTSTSRGHKRRDLSSPPTTEGLPPKRRVRIVSSGHPFLAWKDEDGTVRVGSKISWTNDNFFLVHEYKLLEDHRTVVPMYFTSDGILRVGGPPEIPATVAVNPKGVSVLKLESPTQLSVESSRKVSAL
ncbi:hypothetical protein FOZ60_008914 [Perkinsus olseni]|uniref:Uncharacterized protein n=1 Tax=Perkinsus olseni TaxID=32597 RepID=A0A7J6NIH0_PEROL|nr:hypothetical protein FOZ60_008914 [Perkinsus olseni]